jgi:predicted helicase
MIEFYNQELGRYQQDLKTNKNLIAKDFVKYNATKIAWNTSILKPLEKGIIRQFDAKNIVTSLYRPFIKSNCYYNKEWNEGMYQMPKIFPENGLDNLVIGVSGKGGGEFNILISDILPELHCLAKQSQVFPLKLYEPILDEKGKGQDDIFSNNSDNIITASSGQKYKVQDGITDDGLKHFTDFYKNAKISKEDLFYYIYGLLHSPDYKKCFANNLIKDLPRIPKVKNIVDFWSFSKAGRNLADLHLNYENKKAYKVDYKNDITALEDKDFYVEKMKFVSKEDKSSIIYNHKITIKNIPLEAYDYIVNGKSAVEWVMDRQRISTHKDSQITNNPNDWANEKMNNAKYPLELLLKVIAISVDTVRIVNKLPKLEFYNEPK